MKDKNLKDTAVSIKAVVHHLNNLFDAQEQIHQCIYDLYQTGRYRPSRDTIQLKVKEYELMLEANRQQILLCKKQLAGFRLLLNHRS